MANRRQWDVWWCCPVLPRSANPRWFGVCASDPESAFQCLGHDAGATPGRGRRCRLHFIDPTRFQQLIDQGELLEWAEIHGGLHRSGTLAQPVRAAAATGVPVLIEVDLAGARAIKKTMPEAVTVFLAPPSWQDLQARLIGRGTETADVIQRRLDTARIELAAQGDFDKVVVNRRLESACAELVSLLVGTAPGSP
ncbi:guanylate kinase gmk [Mycobacterium tuberculosis GM 1503]|nr:guanylate kinase gmk [Mycobacterium tuberculosis GM 1503]